MQSSNYDELNALLHQIQNGLPPEKQSALNQLIERVQGSDDPGAWNILGMAYVLGGHPDAAVKVFNKLVSIYPDEDLYRLNLGTAYSQAEQAEMAQYHFKYLAEHGTSENGRRDGQKYLTTFQQRLGKNQLDKQFREYQVAALYERLSEQNTSAEDYKRLAFLLLQSEKEIDAPASLNEITALLESGQSKHPQAVGILELLALCYSRQGLNERLMNVLQRIERLSPESPVLQVLDDIESKEADMFQEKRERRAQELLNQSQSKDSPLRQAALDELRNMVTMSPNNTYYRSVYALALAGIGRGKEAINQAEILARNAGEDHNLHFNIGQIFWLSGDSQRGKTHLELASQYATNEEERREVQERIAYLTSISR